MASRRKDHETYHPNFDTTSLRIDGVRGRITQAGREHRLPSAAEAAPYIASINDAIRKKMVYPRDHAGKRCTAHVEQEQTGKVVRIRIEECASKQLRQAVERAIALASPLPLPEGDMLFNRHLVLEFVVPTET